MLQLCVIWALRWSSSNAIQAILSEMPSQKSPSLGTGQIVKCIKPWRCLILVVLLIKGCHKKMPKRVSIMVVLLIMFSPCLFLDLQILVSFCYSNFLQYMEVKHQQQGLNRISCGLMGLWWWPNLAIKHSKHAIDGPFTSSIYPLQTWWFFMANCNQLL